MAGPQLQPALVASNLEHVAAETSLFLQARGAATSGGPPVLVVICFVAQHVRCRRTECDLVATQTIFAQGQGGACRAVR